MNYYNTNFICTYQLQDDDVNNDLYRTQLLQAFNMDEYNDNINKNIDKLYYFLKKNNKEYLNQIINIIKNNRNLNNLFIFKYGENDEKCYFNILFMFDLFYLSHKYFCDIINNGIIKKKNIK